MEAEAGLKQPQAKECQELAEKASKGYTSEASTVTTAMPTP